MTSFIRTIGIVCSLLLTLGLLGCSTDSSKKSAQTDKPVATAASQDNNVKVATKADTQAEKKVTTESKNGTPSQPKGSQNQQPASSAVTTSNAKNTAKDSSKTAATKPAAPGTASKPTTKLTNASTVTSTTTKTQEPAATVTLSVEGPKDRGTIMSSTNVGIKEGDTVYDVLLQAAKKQNIVLDSSGSGSTAYIQGIDNIYEFDYGAKSGWLFKLNGVSLTKSVGSTNVKDGDRIECYYTE